MNRRRTILGALLVALVASGAWSIHHYPRTATVERLKYQPGSKGVAERKRAAAARQEDHRDDPDRLRIDVYEQYQPTFTGYRRNPFQPIFVDKESFLARQAAAAESRARKAKPVPTVVKPVALPSGTQRELAGFRFHGFLRKDGRKVVFLAKGDEMLLVKEGDTLAGRYFAASLTDQVLVLRVAATGEELVMPLVEGSRRGTVR